MNMLDRFISLVRSKAVTSNAQYMAASSKIVMGEEAKKQPFSYASAVKSYSSWVYAAANLNAVAVASQPLRLYVRSRGGRKLWNTRAVPARVKAFHAGALEHLPSRHVIRKAAEYGDDYEVVADNHPVLDLLERVNPYQNGYDATVLRILYTELTGNAYLHPVVDKSLGVPVELWTMPSQFVEIVPGKQKFIDGYLYGASREQRALFAADEVIHFKRPNPNDLYYGIGKAEAAWGAIMSNDEIHSMDYHFFANKARPDWLMTIKGMVSPDELDRLEKQIDEKLRGSKRTGRFLTASADVDIKPLSFPPKDLQGRSDIVEEIAAVFGVPVSMLKANDPNLASATVGFASWKANTILPLLRMDEEVLNQALLPMFNIDGDAFLAYDNPVLSDERFEFEKHRSSVAGGIMTVNEARTRIGLDASDDPAADRLLMGNQPLGGPTGDPAAPEGPSAGIPAMQPPEAAAGQPADAAPSPAAPPAEPDQTDAVGKAETEIVAKCAGKSDCGCGCYSGQNAMHVLGAVDEKASDPCVSDKIGKLMDEGYDQDQAVAIAISMCEDGATKSLEDIDTKPPQSVADNARRALEVRDEKPESQRGMTAVGIARARDLMNRKPLSEETIRRMVAYFERHEVDKQGESWDEQGKGWQAWMGWGGDEGWSWAKRKRDEFDRAREKSADKFPIAAATMGTKDCGTGAGGFKPGNDCGKGDGSGGSDQGSISSKKPGAWMDKSDYPKDAVKTAGHAKLFAVLAAQYEAQGDSKKEAKAAAAKTLKASSDENLKQLGKKFGIDMNSSENKVEASTLKNDPGIYAKEKAIAAGLIKPAASGSQSKVAPLKAEPTAPPKQQSTAPKQTPPTPTPADQPAKQPPANKAGASSTPGTPPPGMLPTGLPSGFETQPHPKNTPTQEKAMRNTPIATQAIIDYSESKYRPINAQLRAAQLAGTDTNFFKLEKEVAIKVAALDIVTRIDTRDEKTTVFRGSGNDVARIVDSLGVGDTFTDHGYQSTSTNPNKSMGFKSADGVLMKISTNQGVSIKAISSHGPEDEVLLPRGARMKITSKEWRYVPGQGRMLVVEMDHLETN